MSKPWLSILLPSKRLDGLRRFVESLSDHADDWDGIELSLVLDDSAVTPHMSGDAVFTYVALRDRDVPGSVADLFEIAYLHSSAPHVLLANDDLLCETPHWDTILKFAVTSQDRVALVWPDDQICGATLACFPLTTRFVLDHVFPMPPFQRYKVDDTIMDCVPVERRQFVPEVVMKHLNVSPFNEAAMLADNQLYVHDAMRRDEVRAFLASKMQSDQVRFGMSGLARIENPICQCGHFRNQHGVQMIVNPQDHNFGACGQCDCASYHRPGVHLGAVASKH